MSKPKPPPPTLDALQRYTIPEAAALLRISRATLFKQLAAHEVASFCEGKRRFISGAEIIRRSAPPGSPATTAAQFARVGEAAAL